MQLCKCICMCSVQSGTKKIIKTPIVFTIIAPDLFTPLCIKRQVSKDTSDVVQLLDPCIPYYSISIMCSNDKN